MGGTGILDPTDHTAGIAQLVERNFAKVEVAGSSPVSRFTSNEIAMGEPDDKLRAELDSMAVLSAPAAAAIAGMEIQRRADVARLHDAREEKRAAFRRMVDATPLRARYTFGPRRRDILYTVTTISAYDKSTVGIFRNILDADELVRENQGDIWETIYHLAVIEEVRVGHLYGGLADRKQWWYKWIGPNGYRECEVPEQFKNVIGYGIG